MVAVTTLVILYSNDDYDQHFFTIKELVSKKAGSNGLEPVGN